MEEARQGAGFPGDSAPVLTLRIDCSLFTLFTTTFRPVPGSVAWVFKVPATAITSARTFLFWLGILLIYAGIALRLYAIHVLGASFTTAVAVASEQTVIETGPYRLIRHPSYTGFLITLLGLGLSSTNWLSLLVLMGCALIGLSYRIHVEEHVLQEHLGQRYQEYMRRTKRLIPFVL